MSAIVIDMQTRLLLDPDTLEPSGAAREALQEIRAALADVVSDPAPAEGPVYIDGVQQALWFVEHGATRYGVKLPPRAPDGPGGGAA